MVHSYNKQRSFKIRSQQEDSHRTGIRSLFFVLYACSALFIDLYWYTKGFSGISNCFCNITHRTCLPFAFWWFIYCPFSLVSSSIRGDSNRWCSISSASISVSSSRLNRKGWLFSNLPLNGAAMRAKFDTNSRNTLQTPGNNLILFILTGCCRLWIL